MAERKNFYIAKIVIEKEEEKKETDVYEAEHFISPFSGREVPDKKVVPGVKYDKAQYFGLDGEEMGEDGLIKQYGRNYYEDTKRRQEETKRSIPSYYTKEEYTTKPKVMGPVIETIPEKRPVVEKPTQTVQTPEETYDYYEEHHEETPSNNGYEEDYTPINDDYIPEDENPMQEQEEEYPKSSFDDISIPLHNEEEEKKEELPTYSFDLLEEITPTPVKPTSNTEFPKQSQPTSPRQPQQPTPRPAPKAGPSNEPVERKPVQKKKIKYKTPPLSLLRMDKTIKAADNSSCEYQRNIIDQTLAEFRIPAHVVNYTKGPTVTQFEIKLDSDAGVKVERITGISGNLQMNLEVRAIRIQAPIPGKPTIGIEVPNMIQDKVIFGELLSNPSFLNDGKVLNTVLGLDVGGNPVYLNLSDMPHALVAGSTGSGKSVCINSIITSILYKASPDEVKLILIDPKMIEFSAYEDIPHLATPVITDSKLANAALKWAVEEMGRRYVLFKKSRVNELSAFNEMAKEDPYLEPLPYMVIIIDELADLMMACGNAVEENIQRLAQKSRACGIHLIVATQRPSTDVIKGTIKANIMTRIAFAVKSPVDSITILDHSGADKLLGKGDMLYCDGRMIVDLRIQGTYISLDEIKRVTNFLREDYTPKYMFTSEDLESKAGAEEGEGNDPFEDEYFASVAKFVVENNAPSINRIQKKFQMGFNRAQFLMNGLETYKIVSEVLPNKTRTVLVTMEELENILGDKF